MFVTPTIPIIAKQVDRILKSGDKCEETCHKFYEDYFNALVSNYHPDVFKKNTGLYFPEMKKNLSLYIEKSPDSLIKKLQKLRKEGIKVILITASHIDYTELLMTYAFGKNWHSLFDLICCRAKKPGFFKLDRKSSPFFTWDEENCSYSLSSVEEVCPGSIHLEGNWSDVDYWIKKNTFHGITESAYIGDSFKSDIVPTKVHSTWKMIAIVLEGKFCPRSDGFSEKKPKVTDLLTKMGTRWNTIFGPSTENPTLYGSKLLSYPDAIFSDINVFVDINFDKELIFKDDVGNFYDFYPLYK